MSKFRNMLTIAEGVAIQNIVTPILKSLKYLNFFLDKIQCAV